MSRLAGKVAIVTGGASGIGAGIVNLFQSEGAIVIAADINESALAKISEQENVSGMKLDVTSDKDWESLVENVINEHGKIDILINNAGISSEAIFSDINQEDFSKMLSINGYGAFAGIKYVAPRMAKQKKGAIVNISSYTAIIGQGFNHYTASKGAVRAFSKAASTEFAKDGIRVNAIFPGVIDTPMTQNLSASKEVLNYLVQATPLKRLGTPEDIAQAALFLSSDESTFITGAELVIDGGFSAQ